MEMRQEMAMRHGTEVDEGRYLRVNVGGSIDDNGVTTDLFSCYTYKKHFIGKEEAADMLYSRGIEPEIAMENSYICQIGFNSKEQKWYGWDPFLLENLVGGKEYHLKYMKPFGIGDTVKKGDRAYLPTDKEDLEDIIISYHHDDVFKYEITHGIPEVDTLTGVDEVPAHILNNNLRPGLGVGLKTWSKDKVTGKTRTSNYWEPYPEKWGRGEYTIHSLEEARQAAIDFGPDVSLLNSVKVS